jgi:hypothetical protein
MRPSGYIVVKNKLASQKGQALVEGVISTGAWLLFSVIILHLIYAMWTFYCLSFNSHEALICRQAYLPSVGSYSQKQWCQNKLTSKLNFLLPFGRLTQVEFKNLHNSDCVTLVWNIPIKLTGKFNDLGYKIKFQDSVTVPLTTQ